MILSALQTLRAGGTLIYPTDTIWGIGCDATNSNAVEKIYQIKERDHSKSMLILCADEAMLRQYIPNPTPEALDLLLHSDRPTTVIFPNVLQLNKGTVPNLVPEEEYFLANNLLAADGSIGVRIPHMNFCQELLRAFGRPIVSTSANLSGHPSPTSYENIEKELIQRVDYCVPNSPNFASSCTNGSRIVKLTDDNEIIVIRP